MLPPDKKKIFRKLWLAGVKEREIARILKLRLTLIPIYARLLGLPPRKKRSPFNRKLSDEDLELIKEMWHDGATIKEIAEYFGVTQRTISDYLHAMGLRRRVVKRCPEIDKDELERLCIEGFTDEEIAKMYNTSKNCIVRLRQKYGISKRAIFKRKYKEKLERQIDLVVRILEGKGFTTSRELREKYNVSINRRLLEALESSVEGLKWFKLVYTSTANFSVFPARFSNMTIIYLEGSESKVISFLLRNLVNKNIPRRIIKIVLKTNNVPEELIEILS